MQLYIILNDVPVSLSLFAESEGNIYKARINRSMGFALTEPKALPKLNP